MRANSFWRSKMAEVVKNNEKRASAALGQNDPAAEITDTVEISAAAEEKAARMKAEMAGMSDMFAMYREQMEAAREQGEALAESAITRMKCLTIARRIMFGDKVPAADYRYLAKNDLELYAKAVSLRMENEKPKKYKRLSEEEKEETEQASNTNESQSSGDAAGEVAAGEAASGETQGETQDQTETNTDSE